MRGMFGTNGTSPCYPSTARPVVVRRIPTGGQEVLRAIGVATRETGRGFVTCRDGTVGKVCQAKGEGGVWKREGGSAGVASGAGDEAEQGAILEVFRGRLRRCSKLPHRVLSTYARRGAARANRAVSGAYLQLAKIVPPGFWQAAD
jgi:hypothetical protein